MNEWIDGPPPVGFRGPCMLESLYDNDEVKRRVIDITDFNPTWGEFIADGWSGYASLKRIRRHCPLAWPKEKA